MSHRLVSGGSPHGLCDSISLCLGMRLYFLNMGARMKNLSKSSAHLLHLGIRLADESLLFFSFCQKSTIFVTCRQFKSL